MWCGICSRIRETTSFSLEKEVYLYLTEVVKWRCRSQLIGLTVTAWVESWQLGLAHWRVIHCYLQLFDELRDYYRVLAEYGDKGA